MLPRAAPPAVRPYVPAPWCSVVLVCLLFAAAGCSSTKPGEKRSSLNEAGNISARAMDTYTQTGHTAMAVGGLLGARWGRVEWDYRHPILVEERDGETFEVNADAVQYFSLFAGATVTPFRMGSFSFDVDLDGGYQFFGGTTNLAFENDLYKDSGFLEILTNVVYRQVE